MEKKHNVQLKITDHVVIKRINRSTGEVLDEETFHNLIVDSGLARVADLIGKISSVGFEYIAIGEGAVAPANGDTALGNESARESATITQPTAVQTKFEKVFQFGSGESYTITEAGLFDLASSGTMLDRLTFSGKSVDSNTDLSVAITITVSRV